MAHQRPSQSALSWAAGAVGGAGAGAKVLTTEGLHDGSSPWRLCVEAGDGHRHDVILRVAGWVEPRQIVTGAAALRLAEEHDLAAPRLIAADLDGSIAGAPATLETFVAGSSDPPGSVSAAWLRESGAAIAKVHAVRLDPTSELPLRIRPISADDHAMERRWANLYRACEAAERPAVVQALSDLTGWPAGAAERTMRGTACSPLLQLADDRLRALDRPASEPVFVHGDVWVGNMRWDGDTCLALIDWKDAGAGDPGVDLGSVRLQAAIQYGLAAPEHVLQGWQAEAGRPAANVAYWDVVAALNTPAVLDGPQAVDEQGKAITVAAATRRRDEFLRTALGRLEPSGRIPRASRYA